MIAAVPLAEGDRPSALEVRGLTKEFPGVRALDGVAFTLRHGEIHAVIGQNGAGKSTMINVLSGMLVPDSGELRLAGAPVAVGNTRRAIELGIATVYQELSLLPNLTVAQNIVLGREPRRHGLLDVGAMRLSAREALARVGVAIGEDVRVGTLSIAERQLVEIAKALAHHPTVLILDEPTASLGGREVERLFAILKALRTEGIAIVYVSHRFREVLDLCDRATVLRNGQVVATTDLAGWTEADLTEAMVGGRSELYLRSRTAASGAPILEVRGLSYRREVSEVSFTLRRGEILALTGLVGAGQNAIGRIVAGDLRPDRGTVSVDGRPVALRGPAKGIAAGICLVTDDRKQEGIFANLSLRENIALPSLDRRSTAGIIVNAAAERAAVQAVAERFGVVAASLNVPVRTLSGGNQQKMLMARWHLNDSAVFVLIEPTHGVDVAARAEIYRRLDALAAAGKSLIVVSSDLQEILALADRILIVRDGRIAAETTPAATDEERLALLLQRAA